MKPNASPTNAKSPSATGFPLGFLLGVVGGMAVHYLTHSPKGQHLRQQLLEIYEPPVTTTPPSPSPEPVMDTIKPFFTRLLAKFTRPSSPEPADKPTPIKHFFTKRK